VDLSTYEFYLWGALKQKVYHNNPHTLAKLEANIQAEIAVIQEKELKSMAMVLLVMWSVMPGCVGGTLLASHIDV
jgi:hypothetical protein